MAKKVRISLALVFLMVAQMLMASYVFADPTIKVVINGEPAQFNPPPVMIKGKILVPLRQVLEQLGAKVEWDDASQTVTATRGLSELEMTIDEDYARVNGRWIDLDVSAKLINGKAYAPIRVVSQGLGARVDWDPTSWTVNITLELLKPLEGNGALVRDSIVNTMLANSAEFTIEGEAKAPDFPQLNLFKLDGKKDGTTYYVNGHALGWFFEALYYDDLPYFKNIVFNNQWVGVKEFGLKDEEIKELKESNRKEMLEAASNMKEEVTNLVQSLGDPTVIGDEAVNGINTTKMRFTPPKELYQPYLDGQNVSEDVTELEVTVWVDKQNARLYQIDFNSTFYDNGQGGYVKFKADFKNINGNVSIVIPEVAKK